MNLLSKTTVIIAVMALLTSCASIVSKSNWPLTVNTDPNGAKIEITDKKGLVVYNGNSPATLTLKSGAGFFTKQSYKIKISLDGYGEKIIPVDCKLNGWYFGNIIFGGLIGILIVDPATGAMYKLEREYLNETLAKNTSDNTPELKIMNINDIPADLRKDLVCIK